MADAPTGPNIRSNPYYAKENHVRLARIDRNRTEFFGTIGGVPSIGLADPIIFAATFDDPTDIAMFNTTRGGTYLWATHLTAVAPTPDGNGGWTGDTLETGSRNVPEPGPVSIDLVYTDATGNSGDTRYLTYYIRTPENQDSNTITEQWVVN